MRNYDNGTDFANLVCSTEFDKTAEEVAINGLRVCNEIWGDTYVATRPRSVVHTLLCVYMNFKVFFLNQFHLTNYYDRGTYLLADIICGQTDRQKRERHTTGGGGGAAVVVVRYYT